MHAQVQSKDKIYLRLFDIINNSQEYNEKKIIEKLNISGMHFRREKKILFDSLLRSLRDYNSGDVKEELKEDILNIDILLSRTLFESSGKLIEKNLEKAIKHDKYSVVLDLFEERINYNDILTFPGLTFEDIKNQHREIDLTIEKIKTTFLYARKKEVFTYLSKNNLSLAEAPEISDKEIQEVESKFSDSYNIMYKCYTYAYAYFTVVKKNPSKAIGYLIKNNRLIEKLNMEEHYLSQYLYSINNEANYKLKIKEYDDFNSLLEKIKKLDVKKPNLKFRQFYFYNMLTLNYYIMTGEFVKGVQAINSLDFNIILQSQAGEQYKQKFLQRIAELCYFAMEYKKCKPYLSQINNFTDNNEDENIRWGITTTSKILKIIIAYEEKDMDLVEYESNMLYRYLEKNNALEPYEKTILSFFNKIKNNKIINTKEIESFKKLKKELGAISQPDPSTLSFRRFSITAWVDNKVGQTKG